MTESILAEKVTKGWPPEKWRDFTVLIGVSGGADSVCLLRIVHEIKIRAGGSGKLVIAHVNHRLRGEESDRDADFVKALGKEVAIPVEVEALDRSIADDDSNRGRGLEARLREERYQTLQRLAAKNGGRFLLTGHTRDDQVETVLFRIMRGTGIDGLAGIPFSRAINDSLTVVRPLLKVSRQEILQHLGSIGQDFRVDSTNETNQFTRNRIRNNVLPLLRDIFDNPVDDSIIKLADQARANTELLRQLTAPILKDGYSIESHSFRVFVDDLGNIPRELVKVALRHAWQKARLPSADMTAAKWEELTSLACGDDETACDVILTFPGAVRVVRTANNLAVNGPESAQA